MYLSWIEKTGLRGLQIATDVIKLDVVEQGGDMIGGERKKHPGGRPSTGFPRWASKLLFIETEHIQAVALAKLLGISRPSIYNALAKHGIFVSVRLEDSYYRGYYETAKLHDLARRASAREQDATKSSISVKNKEVGLCS